MAWAAVEGHFLGFFVVADGGDDDGDADIRRWWFGVDPTPPTSMAMHYCVIAGGKQLHSRHPGTLFVVVSQCDLYP